MPDWEERTAPTPADLAEDDYFPWDSDNGYPESLDEDAD